MEKIVPGNSDVYKGLGKYCQYSGMVKARVLVHVERIGPSPKKITIGNYMNVHELIVHPLLSHMDTLLGMSQKFTKK